MRRSLLSFVLMLCLSGMASAATTVNDWLPNEPSITDSGGPDGYGYTWKDSNDPGGPAYAWRDLSSVGLVVPLGDDTYVGPYPIGFSFHYYWYNITQLWAVSNGYLQFGQPLGTGSPFPNFIPLTTPPNDFLAVYMADFDFSAGGQCRIYNNADSLIVSYTNAPAWGLGGSHSFQVILSRLDSNITFQYGAQTGTVAGNDILVGIENVSGTMGLMHSNDVYPPSNYAIKWEHPANPTAVINDLATIASANANSQGFFVMQGSTVNGYGRIKNMGNAPATGFIVNCTVTLLGGGVVYSQAQVINTPLAPNAEMDINFTPVWTTSLPGTYTYSFSVTLAGDLNPNNDFKITECHVLMPLLGTLYYDDGSSEMNWGWQGRPCGLAQHFMPPIYPVVIDSLFFYIATITGSSPFTARILDDDGPSGSPGTQLFSAQVTNPTSPGWRGVAVVPPVNVTSGGFYVAWIMVDALTRPLGVDVTPTQPVSRQSWEYLGVWSPFRNLEVMDPMIRARITPAPIPPLDVLLIPINPPIVIPANGGSFQFNASVQRTQAPQAAFFVWARDRNPDGTYTGNLLGPVNINPPVGVNVTRQRTQVVASSWPAGLHWYIGYAAPTVSYPATDADSFSWTKSTTADGGPTVWEAACYGEPFPGEVMASAAPAAFSLDGAYPNPFNPATTISFTLPEPSLVTLKVFDVSGRQVATLLDDWRDVGTHQAAFDGSNLASGIYLYTLKAGRYNATGKMVLMK